MTDRAVTPFATAANPAIREALEFVLDIVPHPRGHCLIALPVSVRPVFDDWIERHRDAWVQDEQDGKEIAYTGLAMPDIKCGFFCVQFRDIKRTQKEIEDFLKAMNLWGTENYLIIRKEKRPKISANPLPRVSNDH